MYLMYMVWRCLPAYFQVAVDITDGQGTKENEYCSNHGVCDFETGTCSCDRNTTYFPDEWYWWESSDGYGGPGGRGDCGYQREESATNVNQSCPVGVVFEDENTPTYGTVDQVRTDSVGVCCVRTFAVSVPQSCRIRVVFTDETRRRGKRWIRFRASTVCVCVLIL